MVFYELEDKKNLQDWAPKAMSRRILSILDRLLDCMRCQNVPSYIFSNKNLLLQDNFLENDCVSDGDILENYLKLLHIDGNILKRDDDEWSKVKAQMENVSQNVYRNQMRFNGKKNDKFIFFSPPPRPPPLQVMLQKWENVIGSMLPPMSTRRTRLNVVGGSTTNISYTRQQIEYVAMLIREVLILRNIQRTKEISDNIRENDFDDQLKNREDFLYLLQIMFDQAKQKFLNSAAFRSRSKLIQRSEAIKLDQVALSYDISTAMIVDDVKRSKDVTFRFVDDISIVVRVSYLKNNNL